MIKLEKMIFMTKHSPVACLSKATLFTDLPVDLKKKLVAVSEHQQKFPKEVLLDNLMIVKMA